MPGGGPVGTLAIGVAGAINAAILAGSIISLEDDKTAIAIEKWRKRQTDSVADYPNNE